METGWKSSSVGVESSLESQSSASLVVVVGILRSDGVMGETGVNGGEESTTTLTSLVRGSSVLAAIVDFGGQ